MCPNDLAGRITHCSELLRERARREELNSGLVIVSPYYDGTNIPHQSGSLPWHRGRGAVKWAHPDLSDQSSLTYGFL